jgi:hypothetical protein
MKYQIEKVSAVKEGEKNGEQWKTIDVVLKETEGEYPNSFVANLFKKGEYIKMVDSFSTTYPVGQVVEAELKFSAKEYNGRDFQNVSLWSIKKEESGKVTQDVPVEEDSLDNIPF